MYETCIYMTHVIHISYKSCRVKYSQHCSLSCKLQPIIICHFRLCSLWDKGPSHHSASQRHLRVLPALLEVATALCRVAERSSATWRRATLGHTAAIQPLPPPSRGRRCVVLCPVTKDDQELSHSWCACHLAGLFWARGWVWSFLPCSSPMLRPLSIFKLTCTTCAYLADTRAKQLALPACGTKD